MFFEILKTNLKNLVRSSLLVHFCNTLRYSTTLSGFPAGVVGVEAIGVVLVSLLLTLTFFAPCSIVIMVNFEHVIASRVKFICFKFTPVFF